MWEFYSFAEMGLDTDLVRVENGLGVVGLLGFRCEFDVVVSSIFGG